MEKMLFDLSQKAKDMNGVVRTRDIEAVGIPRTQIERLIASGYVVKESRGLYSVVSEMTDEFAAIQRRSDRLVFSHGTALFFHGLSDRAPMIIDVTVPQGYNVSRIKKDYGNLRFHYVKPELLNLGSETITSPQGSKIVAYNKERCICDLIKSHKKTDRQIFTQAVREYFGNKYSARDLIRISREIGVENEVRKYMEVL